MKLFDRINELFLNLCNLIPLPEKKYQPTEINPQAERVYCVHCGFEAFPDHNDGRWIEGKAEKAVCGWCLPRTSVMT